MARKITEVIVKSLIDQEGEIVSEERRTKYRADGEPEYIKLYLNTVLYLKSLPKGYNPILLAFLKRMSYATTGQKVYVNASMKREIAKEINASVSYINTALTDFVKGKLIFRVDTGTYQFNPTFFGKGDWKDIEKIQATITFSPEGTDFATEITKTDKLRVNRQEAIESKPSVIVPDEQSATIEPTLSVVPVKPTVAPKTCKICGKELVDIPKHDGTSFLGCKDGMQHKKDKALVNKGA